MGRDDFNQDWQRLSEEILSGLHEWRVQHPQATLCQIETAIDDRLTRLRTKLLQDAALATPAADWTSAPPLSSHAVPSVRSRCMLVANRHARSKRMVVAMWS